MEFLQSHQDLTTRFRNQREKQRNLFFFFVSTVVSFMKSWKPKNEKKNKIK